jgi:hypothetical protein
MTRGYRWASAVVVLMGVLAVLASYQGWGVPSDAQALAQRQSVRGGSLHARSFYGGGPGFGK